MEEVLAHLNDAIEFVKGIAPDVWALYVRQQVVYGYTYTLGAALGVIFSVVGFKMARKGGNINNAYGSYSDGDGWMLLGMLLLIAASITAGVCTAHAILYLSNPAYYAFKELLP